MIVPTWQRITVALIGLALSLALATGIGQLIAGWLG